eukprot:517306_1
MYNTNSDQSLSNTTNYSTCSSSCESSDDDLFSTLEMAFAMMQMDEDILLAKHGYIKSDKILKKTVQGDLFTAKNENDELVAIKKVSKKLHLNNECIDIDDPKWVHIVDKDIVKEAKILKYLTKENKAINDSIVEYIDFFETEKK